MLSHHTIGVVIPAFNEERLLPVTLSRLPDFVDHVVVVDDASTDATSRVAGELGANLILHEHNKGVGAAIVSGYRWCWHHGVDIAVVVAADNQMHPDDMTSLVDPVTNGVADYVTGDRLAWPGGWRAFPPVRLVGVVALAAMTRRATGLQHVRDAQCGYTALRVGSLASLDLDAVYPRYGFPNDFLAKVALAGLRTTSRPVRPIYADEQSGLSITRVVVPLLGLTAANWWRRKTTSDSAPRPVTTVAHAPQTLPAIAMTPPRSRPSRVRARF